MPASAPPPAAASCWAGTLREFLPGRMAVDARERWRVSLGALLGVLLTGLLCRSPARPSGLSHGDKPAVVGQIMTRQVRVTCADRPLAELVPLFADTGHHHIPVIDGEQRLVGILTQSDLVRALSRGG
jgi:CBS-domain-containing membrane protein